MGDSLTLLSDFMGFTHKKSGENRGFILELCLYSKLKGKSCSVSFKTSSQRENKQSMIIDLCDTTQNKMSVFSSYYLTFYSRTKKEICDR